MASSTYRIPVAVATGFVVNTFTITNGGTRYKEPPTITITGGGGDGAKAIATISNGIVTSIDLVVNDNGVLESGVGYISSPSVGISAPEVGGTQAIATVTVDTSGVAIAGDFISSDIKFVEDEFVPGKAALIRMWFCIETTTDNDTIISVSHQSGTNLEQLNADNNFVIKSKGLYRFDIPAIVGDSINVQSSVAVPIIRLLRFEKIVFGA